jgi:hypothetical protein
MEEWLVDCGTPRAEAREKVRAVLDRASKDCRQWWRPALN